MPKPGGPLLWWGVAQGAIWAPTLEAAWQLDIEPLAMERWSWLAYWWLSQLFVWMPTLDAVRVSVAPWALAVMVLTTVLVLGGMGLPTRFRSAVLLGGLVGLTVLLSIRWWATGLLTPIGAWLLAWVGIVWLRILWETDT